MSSETTVVVATSAPASPSVISLTNPVVTIIDGGATSSLPSTVFVTASPEAGTTVTIQQTQLPPAKTVATVTTSGWAPPSWSTTFMLPPTPIVTLEQSPAPTTDVYLVYPTPQAYNVFPCQSDHTYYIPEFLDGNDNHFAICSKGQVWTSAALCGGDAATVVTANGTTVSMTAPLPEFQYYTTKPVFYLNVPPVQCYRGGAWVLAYDTVVASAQTEATKYVNANAAPTATAVPQAMAGVALLALLF
ncbi:hypothetical protein CJU90_5818 [Yarrowia sp. C11]|nr:hypothetical protein CJU90_5818 [Yarrowia sp. C11]KAG5364397.1 hypothetical protein CKK34_3196 [Yarrowia sp. E02]